MVHDVRHSDKNHSNSGQSRALDGAALEFVLFDGGPFAGKIDRNSLPVPGAETAATGDETGSSTERAITEIWKSVLGVDQVGLTDNFFDVGGHSLLVIQVQRRMAEHFGRETAITDMFRFTTIAALAAHIDGSGAPGGQDATTRGTARALARRRRMASR